MNDNLLILKLINRMDTQNACLANIAKSLEDIAAQGKVSIGAESVQAYIKAGYRAPKEDGYDEDCGITDDDRDYPGACE